MLGTSPFIGAAQFGRKSHEYRMKFFYNEENMKELFIKSAELGVKAVQLIAYEPLVRALKKAEEETGEDFFVAATKERRARSKERWGKWRSKGRGTRKNEGRRRKQEGS